MFYRYELYVDDEYQGVGIFYGLSELNLDEDFENSLLSLFEKELKFVPIEERCEFLFTEAGNKKFRDHIQKILAVFEEDTLFEVKCLMVNADDVLSDYIIYKDTYQIAVMPEMMEEIRRKGMKKNASEC